MEYSRLKILLYQDDEKCSIMSDILVTNQERKRQKWRQKRVIMY